MSCAGWPGWRQGGRWSGTLGGWGAFGYPESGPIEFAPDFKGSPSRPHRPSRSMPLTSNQIRALLWALIAVVSALLLSLLAPVLMPFLLAAVLAYALHPLVERLHARRVPRWLGAGLAIALLMLVLLAVMLLIVPVITKQVPLLRDQVPLLLV
eukprot:gene42621-56653_t